MPVLNGPDNFNNQFTVAADGTISLTSNYAIAPSAWTPGSVPYAISTGALAEDNANHFWDGVNHRLGIGTTAPLGKLTLSGLSQVTSSINTAGTMANSLVLDDTSNATGSGGTILFTGNTGAWRFAAIRGFAVSGSGNSQGDIVISTRRVSTDTTLTEGVRFQYNGNVGIGVPGVGTIPSKFMVQTNPATLPGGGAGVMAHIATVDAQPTRLLIDNFAAGGVLALRRGNTTAAAPSSLAANDLIGTVGGTGYSTAYNNAIMAGINFYASEAFTTATNQGTYITLTTTPNGTATPTEVVRILNSGNVGIGTTAPGARLQVGAIATSGGAEGSGATCIVSTPADATLPFVLERSGVANPQVMYFGLNHASHYSEIQAAQSAVGNNALLLNRQGGNVGIGTTGPGATLHVGATATSGGLEGSGAVVIFGVPNDGYANVVIQRSGVANPQVLDFGVNQASLYSEIQSSHNGINVGTLLLNRQGGNVGIGTAASAGRLTVSGPGQGTTALNTASIAGSLLVDDSTANINSGGSIVFSANGQGMRFASILGSLSDGGSNSRGNVSVCTRRNAADATLTETARFQLDGVCVNTSGSWSAFSDASLKSAVAPYERGLDAILALRPVSFVYTDDCPFADGTIQYGLVAQEVEPHVPEAVGRILPSSLDKDASELATLDPTHLVYVLINAVKELNDQGKEMVAKIAALESATVH